MKKVVVNIETGEQEYVDLTADEVADAEARAAAFVPDPEPGPSLTDRLAAVEARLDKAANASVTGEAAKLRDQLKDAT